MPLLTFPLYWIFFSCLSSRGLVLPRLILRPWITFQDILLHSSLNCNLYTDSHPWLFSISFLSQLYILKNLNSVTLASDSLPNTTLVHPNSYWASLNRWHTSPSNTTLFQSTFNEWLLLCLALLKHGQKSLSSWSILSCGGDKTYMCTPVCMYVYIHTYIHIYIHIYVCVYIYIYIYIYISLLEKMSREATGNAHGCNWIWKQERLHLTRRITKTWRKWES